MPTNKKLKAIIRTEKTLLAKLTWWGIFIWNSIQQALLSTNLYIINNKDFCTPKSNKFLLGRENITKYTTGLAVSNWKEFKISISAAFQSPRRISFPSSSNAFTWRHEDCHHNFRKWEEEKMWKWQLSDCRKITWGYKKIVPVYFGKYSRLQVRSKVQII